MGARKKTSPLWSHFTEPDGNFRLAKCNHCAEEIKRGKPNDPRKICGNKNMQAHMAKKHSHLNLEVEQLQAEILDARNVVKFDPRDETSRGTMKIFNLRSQADRRTFLERVFPTGSDIGITTEEKRKREMDTAIMFTIILDLQCPSQVNRGGFNVLMAVADPSFKLSTDSYYWSLLDKVYAKGKATLRAILAKDPPQHASLSLDGWSHKHHGYLGLILSWINSDWQRQALCIGCIHMEERHTSQNMAQRIMENCNEWGVMAAIEMVVHDSAANMMAIYNQEDFPCNCIPGRCVCHMLQLVIEDCLFSKPAVVNVIKTSRKICKKAAVSPNFYADLERLQLEKFPDDKPLLLHRDVKVRWNSTWEMFDRMVELKDRGLQEALDMPEWSAKFPSLKTSDWELMANLVKILKIFHSITEQLSHGSACVSEVIPCVTLLLRYLVRTGGLDERGVAGFKDDLHRAVLNRMGDFELERFYVTATFLDPRQKTTFFRMADTPATAKTWVVEDIEAELERDKESQEKVIPSPEPATTSAASEDKNDNLIQQLRKKRKLEKQQEDIAQAAAVTPLSLVEEYLKLPCTEYDNLRFWCAYEKASMGCKVKAALLRVVRRHLTPPPSSTNIERLFSYAGLLLTKKRGNMLPERVDQTLFLRENLFLLALKLEW